MGPISPILIRGHTIKRVIKTRLLRMTVDHKLSWAPHTLELKRGGRGVQPVNHKSQRTADAPI